MSIKSVLKRTATIGGLLFVSALVRGAMHHPAGPAGGGAAVAAQPEVAPWSNISTPAPVSSQEALVLMNAGNWKTATLTAPDEASQTTIDLNKWGDAITITGQIKRGDAERVRRLLLKATRKTDLLLILNSPGGDWHEANLIAYILTYDIAERANAAKHTHLVTAVPADGLCASSCITLFAMGEVRVVQQVKGRADGALYVHSMTTGGIETQETMANDVFWARQLNTLGVPVSVTGKLVHSADPKAIKVSQAEMVEWGVHAFWLDKAGKSHPGSF